MMIKFMKSFLFYECKVYLCVDKKKCEVYFRLKEIVLYNKIINIFKKHINTNKLYNKINLQKNLHKFKAFQEK